MLASQTQQGSVLTPNVCPEGQFLDLTTDYCRNLDKSFGFNATAFAQAFPQQQIAVESCSESGLRSALEQAQNRGGGTVQLPACTIEVNSPISLPNNLILQGHGIQQTIIRASSGLSNNNMISVKHGKNVIVRDMSLHGNGYADRALLAWYADNVLFERLETMHNDSSGLIFRYTSRITIRYIESHNNRVNHGIGSKDCFNETLESCIDSAGDVSPGVLWSQDYAIYSNNLHHNGKYGLDSHASYGEIAGNLMVNNGYGSKFPDVSYVWLHHNGFKQNRSWGTYIYSTLQIPEQYPRNIVFYKNEFTDNGEYPFIAASPSNDIYMIENRYRDNHPNNLRITQVAVYVCPSTEDAALTVNGTDVQTASAAQCDTSSIAHIFGHDSEAPGNPLPETPVELTPVATAVPGTVQPPGPTPAPTAQLLPGDTQTIPGRIEAENYREGGEGVGYHDTTLDNAGDAYRNDHVDIQETEDSQGAYNVGWIEAGEWLAYNVHVEQAGAYTLTARLRSWGPEPRSLRVEIDGQDASGSVQFTQPATGENWFDVQLGSAHFSTGAHVMRIVMESDDFNFNYIDATLAHPAAPPANRFRWARRLGGGGNDTGYGIAVNSVGVLHATGGYFSQMEIDTGNIDTGNIDTGNTDTGSGSIPLTGNGDEEVFMAHFDNSGGLLGAHTLGGPRRDWGGDVAVDSAGNIYVAGRFRDTVDFDPGPGVMYLTAAGDDDIFVLKLDAAGGFQWARAMGGPARDFGLGAAVDALGHVYVIGYFNGTADFDPGDGVQHRTSNGADDIFIAKLDGSGTLQWVQTFGAAGEDYGRGIVADGAGNVYAVGEFEQTVDFDPSDAVAPLTSQGRADAVVLKLDSHGNYAWARQVRSTGGNRARDIAVDSGGNSYVTGYFRDVADLDPGPGTVERAAVGEQDLFVLKLDGNGSYVWDATVGGSGNDEGYGVGLDAAGGVYTVGSFNSTADFDAGSGTAVRTAHGGDDAFLYKLNADGSFAWVETLGGSGMDAVLDLAVTGVDQLYAIGIYGAAFELLTQAGATDLPHSGNADVFVVALE